MSIRDLAGVLLLIAVAPLMFTVVSASEPIDSMNDRFEPLKTELDAWVEKGVLPNVSVLVATADQVLFRHHAGVLDQELGTEVQGDSLFRIYSMTKPVTAVAAMMLVEEGKLELDSPISNVLPEFTNLEALATYGKVPAKPMTLRHLLSHTSGLSYGYSGDTLVDRLYRENGLIDDWDYLVPTTHDLVVGLGEIPLLFQPGDRFHYGFSSDVTSEVIERVNEGGFEDFLNKRLWSPLTVEEAYFNVPEHALDRFGTNHQIGEDNEFVIQDSPREDPEFRGVTFLSGGGGLVMTIDGYAKFAQLLLREGEVDGTQLLSNKSMNEVFSNQIPDSHLPMRYGLGFGIRSIESPGGDSRDVYYWGGAAGTSFWIDPSAGIIGIFMTQLIGAPAEPSTQFSQSLYQILAQST